MATSTDCAWLAGFIDGEGSITLYRQVWKWKEGDSVRRLSNHHREKERYRGLIAVANTHEPTMRHVAAIFEEWGVKAYLQKITRHSSRFSQQDQWHVSVMSFKGCKVVLEHIVPYLVTKREQGEALMRFIEIHGGRDPHLPYTDEQRGIALFLRRHPMHGNPQPSQAGTAEVSAG